MIGEVTADGKFSYGNAEITLDEAYKAWTGTLEKVFKTTSGEENDGPAAMAVKTADPEATYENGVYNTKNIYVCKHKVAKLTYSFLYSQEIKLEADSTRALRELGLRLMLKYLRT